MKYRPTFYVLVFLTLCVWVGISRGQPAESNAVAAIPGSGTVPTAATLSTNEESVVNGNPALEDDGARMSPLPARSKETTVVGDDVQREESRAQHAARINRNMFIVTVSILSFFILCRLWLLWRISQYRKSLAREGTFES